MKRIHFLFLALFAFSAWAGVEDPVSTDDFLKQLLAFVFGPKGGTLAVVAAVVQLAMAFLNTSWGAFVGKYKLAVLYSLSAVLAVVGSLISGVSILEALVSGATLAAIMNAIHQWVKVPAEQTQLQDLKV